MISSCRACGHQLLSLTYAAKFCRNCGGHDVRHTNILQPVILAAAAALVVGVIVWK